MGFWENVLVALVAGIVLFFLVSRPVHRSVVRWARQPGISLGSETHFSILIADLAGDANREQTAQLEEALAGHRGLKIVRVNRTLEPSAGILAVDESVRRAESKGRDWLNNYDARLWVSS